MLIRGLRVTLEVTLYSVILGIIIGMITALIRITEPRGLVQLATTYVEVVRGTPVVVQMVIIYYAILAGSNLPKVIIASIAFGINSGAYVSELIRAGIQAVPRGQMEAARSLGLTWTQAMRFVIVPQAIKTFSRRSSTKRSWTRNGGGRLHRAGRPDAGREHHPRAHVRRVYAVPAGGARIPVYDDDCRSSPVSSKGDCGKVIDVSDLHKSFGELKVLRGVSTHVSRSQVVCVIGASGSGKSTFLRCLNLLEIPDRGRITIDGVELLEHRRQINRLRRKMGMVFQQFNLFPHMTARSNVALGPMQVLGMNRADASARAERCWQRRPGRQGRRISQPAFGRPETAGRDRPRAGDEP